MCLIGGQTAKNGVALIAQAAKQIDFPLHVKTDPIALGVGLIREGKRIGWAAAAALGVGARGDGGKQRIHSQAAKRPGFCQTCGRLLDLRVSAERTGQKRLQLGATEVRPHGAANRLAADGLLLG